MAHGLDRAREQHVDIAGIERGQRRGDAAERHVQQIDPRQLLQQLAGEMIAGADAARPERVLAGLGLRASDQIGEIAEGAGGAHRETDRHLRHQADRGEIAQRIERKLGIDRRHHRHRRGRQQQGAAIGRRLHDRLQADRAAGAGPVLQDEHALGLRRQPLDQEPRGDIDRPAGGVGHNDAHRARRPFLRAAGVARTAKTTIATTWAANRGTRIRQLLRPDAIDDPRSASKWK